MVMIHVRSHLHYPHFKWRNITAPKSQILFLHQLCDLPSRLTYNYTAPKGLLHAYSLYTTLKLQEVLSLLIENPPIVISLFFKQDERPYSHLLLPLIYLLLEGLPPSSTPWGCLSDMAGNLQMQQNSWANNREAVPGADRTQSLASATGHRMCSEAAQPTQESHTCFLKFMPG